jgi:molybdopterin converting factor small subunit
VANIKVKIYGFLRLKTQKSYYEFDIDNSISVSEILIRLQLTDFSKMIMLVNGNLASRTTVLENNDVLSLFPPVGGG